MLAGSLVELGIEHPGVLTELQRGVAGILGGGHEPDQRVVVSPRPGFHLEVALPVGAMNGHRHLRLRTGGAVVVVRVLEDGVRVRGTRSRCGDQNGNQDESGGTKHGT